MLTSDFNAPGEFESPKAKMWYAQLQQVQAELARVREELVIARTTIANLHSECNSLRERTEYVAHRAHAIWIGDPDGMLFAAAVAQAMREGGK